MDPNAALEELRDLAATYLDDENQDLCDFAISFTALDGWLTRGGFLPNDWKHATPN